MKVYHVSYVNKYGYTVITTHYSLGWVEIRRKEVIEYNKAIPTVAEHEQCVLNT